ncbi:MAG: hypothetical protein LUH10_01750 [Tannerellaceae bacterium]|nr:hypothetical protein [Tannerellaceae bacterium]
MKKQNFFWISLSDLMTALFFLLLVLFAVAVVLLKNRQSMLEDKQTTLEIENNRLNNLLRLEQQFRPLQESGDFYYLESCQKYVYKEFMGREIFESNEVVIKNEFVQSTIQAGRKIEEFLKTLNKQNEGFSYILVIEGNMANTWNQSLSKDNAWGYRTSYERALAVYNLWNTQGIDLRKYNTEILICGSGFNGLCRDNVEENNKRFNIQIIPKVKVTH